MSTTKAVTARVAHYCSVGCQWRATEDETPVIQPGHRYLRHVGFPGEDGVSGDRPWVLRQCATCAIEHDDMAATSYGICGSYCHGINPCVLPFERGAPGHECVCRECLDQATRNSETSSTPRGGS